MRRFLLVPAALVALAAPFLTSAADAVDDTTKQRARAPQALARAQALFDGETTSGARIGRGTRPADGTMVLRDLAAASSSYDTEDEATAQRILARPTDGTADPEPFDADKYDPADPVRTLCLTHSCLHWTETGAHAVNTTSTDGDDIPDWVQLVGATLERVWTVEVDRLGYRAPNDDLGTAEPTPGNPDSRFDVYLSELEDENLYGYCGTEIDPDRTTSDSPGYCVLDNDFVYADYPKLDPVTEMRAAAAHEFFHAVQFGYDWGEDTWLMEGSAAWMEDVVYDSANSLRRWLPSSPSTRSWVPLDYADKSFTPYGSWTFLQYLTERVGRSTDVVRRIWEYADASPSRIATDASSLWATDKATREYGVSFDQAFRRYVAGNRTPGRTYTEGWAWPKPKTSHSFTLTAAHPGQSTWWAENDHLSAQAFRYTADRSLKGERKLRLSVAMPELRRKPFATVLIYERGTGKVRVKSISLNRDSDGYLVVPFTRSKVRQVELILGNGSTRYNCWERTWLACQGIPRDDDTRGYFRAKAIRG